MKLRLVRHPEPTQTYGELYVDGTFQCFTLEDQDRRLEAGGKKVMGETAIPLGEYRVTIDYSNRFQRDMLHILDVPGFEGIRIHAGNTIHDTAGCVLVGEDIDRDMLVRSRLALAPLFADIEAAIERDEPVTITIERE